MENYRSVIVHRLRARNCVQREPFIQLCQSYVELLDWVAELKGQIERFRGRKESEASTVGSSDADAVVIQGLKRKVDALTEELTESFRRKNENAQQLIDTSNKLRITEQECDHLKEKLTNAESTIFKLKEANRKLEDDVNDLRKSNQIFLDEHLALQATFNALESNYLKTQEEHSTLLDRWRELKQREVDQLNAENDLAQRKRSEKMVHDIERAVATQVPVHTDSDFADLDALPPVCVGSVIPNRAKLQFTAHEGDVYAVAWSPNDRLFATGGADRRLKLWEIDNSGKQHCCAVLSGCNQSVMCIDFDLESYCVLATSNDHTIRIWTIADRRLRHTFAGHSNKVHCAKFLPGSSRVVSGSHDRTLKLWDLRSRACEKTIFAGSICQDLVTSEGGLSAGVVSGHFDKKLRFWDLMAAEDPIREILMPDKITSLCLSSEKNVLLCCCRDDTLRSLDLRTNKVIREFTDSNFHTGFEFTRAVLSPDDTYCAVGSQDGGLFIWATQTGQLVKVLKGHQASVISCAWSRSGQSIVSGDKQHTVIVWSDY